MDRQMVLIVEAEQPEGLSARKLIIESLKHHVIAAYSRQEALEILERIPVDVALVHSGVHGNCCEELVEEIRDRFPNVAVVGLSPGGTEVCGPVPTLDSLRPEQLVHYFEERPDRDAASGFLRP
jgi:DNA-binding NtrC family response regulator